MQTVARILLSLHLIQTSRSNRMKISSFVGKIMFIVPMAYFGFVHLGNANEMAGQVPSFLPMSVLWVYLSGMGLVLAAIAIIIGKKARLAAQLLGLALVLFATMVHLPEGLRGDSGQMFTFFKDIALAGGALYISSHLED